MSFIYYIENDCSPYIIEGVGSATKVFKCSTISFKFESVYFMLEEISKAYLACSKLSVLILDPPILTECFFSLREASPLLRIALKVEFPLIHCNTNEIIMFVSKEEI